MFHSLKDIHEDDLDWSNININHIPTESSQFSPKVFCSLRKSNSKCILNAVCQMTDNLVHN